MGSNNAHLFDKRIVERNIAKGLVSKAQYQGHIENLPDLEGSYELVSLDEEIEPAAEQETPVNEFSEFL